MSKQAAMQELTFGQCQKSTEDEDPSQQAVFVSYKGPANQGYDVQYTIFKATQNC